MAVPARLALIGFNYSQPFLVTAAVSYVQGTWVDETDDVGYGLIGAAIIIYLGIAVSSNTLPTPARLRPPGGISCLG